MKYRVLILVSLLASIAVCRAQTQAIQYSVANAHSHNDYMNPVPFYTAYTAGFGSIEADIFLFHNRLMVAHDSAGLAANRSLEQWYLQPLDSCVRAHRGSAYANITKQLILLIDIKNAPADNLDSLVALLKRYPTLITCQTVKVVITGNRPDPANFARFPKFIWFDGVLSATYRAEALPRIVLFSDNLRTYINWKGNELLLPGDREKLQTAIARSHALGKPVRFWNAPDNAYAWAQFMQLQSDYINTDHIPELAAFLSK